MRDLFPMTIKRDNTALMREAEAKLNESMPVEKRAELLAQIAWWYRDMNRLDEARRFLEESIALVPTYYHAIKQMLAILGKLGDKPALTAQMSKLLHLDPHNPTVFDDCIIFARGTPVGGSVLLDVLGSVARVYPHDPFLYAS